MVRALAHICFRVTDLERSLAFYGDQLGLRPAFDFKDERGRRSGAYLHVGGRSFIRYARIALRRYGRIAR